MWIVIKFKKEKIQSLKLEIVKKFHGKLDFYIPKIEIEKITNNKFKKKTLKYITDDYLFCKISSFNFREVLLKIKHTKGVKYILNHFQCSQTEIEKFVKKCKFHENEEGNLKSSFFEIVEKSNIQFLNGPFLNQIMTIVENNKKIVRVSLNNLNLSVKKNNNLFQTV
tara:strand:+ start:1205 stop:1705 length:501 start_codon:yes stop_codon:yes gene_type:complete